jgi:hypothetical protein
MPCSSLPDNLKSHVLLWYDAFITIHTLVQLVKLVHLPTLLIECWMNFVFKCMLVSFCIYIYIFFFKLGRFMSTYTKFNFGRQSCINVHKTDINLFVYNLILIWKFWQAPTIHMLIK